MTTDAGLGGRADIPTDRGVLRGGVTVHYFQSSSDRMGLKSPALEAAVAKRVAEFDVVHVTGVWQPTSRAACRAARRAGRPYVCSPRGALGCYSFTQKPWKKLPYYWIWEKANLNGAAALHYTSALELRECGRLRLRPPGFLVPNSVDLGAWRRDEAGGRGWRRTHGIGDDEFVLLYAGRVHHKKGLELLGEVGAALPEHGSWRLVLLGSDEDGTGTRLRRNLAAAGRGERALLLPGVGTHELAAAYSGADVLVFPSRNENFGNVAVEALACGCRVLVSDQVGAAGLIADIPGVKVLPRVAERWRDALSALIAVRSRPPAISRAEVERRFSAEAVAKAMAGQYAGLQRFGGRDQHP
jgi:glycosyltransferase involved in cell wall biosynthesis